MRESVNGTQESLRYNAKFLGEASSQSGPYFPELIPVSVALSG